jgi:hypothetical protein
MWENIQASGEVIMSAEQPPGVRKPRHFEADVLAMALVTHGGVAIEALRRRQKKVERIALAIALSFILFVSALAFLTDGEVFSGTLSVLRSFENPDASTPHNAALNCLDPRNKKMPFCQERTGRLESEWRSVVRSHGGRTNPFSLHERPPRIK